MLGRASLELNMIPECINFFMNVFDFSGFCTQQKSSRRYQRKILILFVLHIISAIVNTLIFINYVNRQAIDILGKTNDIIKLSCELSLYWLSILEMYSKRKIQKLFFENFRRIDIHFYDHRTFQLGSYRLKFLTQQIICLFTFLFYLRIIILCYDILDFWCSYAFIHTFIQYRVFYLLFYLELIKYELNRLLCFSKQMSELFLSNSNDSRNFNAEYSIHLKWFREYYQIIHDVSLNMNEAFGWSNFLTIYCLFLVCLTDSNWFYWKWYNQNISIINYSLYCIAICVNRSGLLVFYKNFYF